MLTDCKDHRGSWMGELQLVWFGQSNLAALSRSVATLEMLVCVITRPCNTSAGKGLLEGAEPERQEKEALVK